MGCCDKMPPTVTQARNALAAAGRVFRAAVRGQQIKAAPETIATRMIICVGCEFCKAIPSQKHPGTIYHRCRHCGCWLDSPYGGKANLATESCPEGKWT